MNDEIFPLLSMNELTKLSGRNCPIWHSPGVKRINQQCDSRIWMVFVSLHMDLFVFQDQPFPFPFNWYLFNSNDHL